MTIEYDGTNYEGWQLQTRKRAKTIQAAIERILKKVLREKIKLIASGRTDSGVHAKAQVANFRTNSKISLRKLQWALNCLLPSDIAIIKIEEASLDFHSCFDAKSKLYSYTILNRSFRSALMRDRVYFYPYSLNVGVMQKAARALLGKHDFSSFQASGRKAKSALRTVKKIKVLRSGCFIRIDIEADGFLYNMVRNIAGTLLEIGRGRLEVRDMKRILRSRNRQLAGPTLPAEGLMLIKVNY